MFLPRLIALLIGFACAMSGMLIAQDIITIPLEFLKWLVAGGTSFFAMSALVMWFGLTDANKDERGQIVFGTGRRGRMMRWIMRWFVDTNEPHCCDVYIGTSISTALILCIGYLFLMLIFLLFTEPLNLFFIVLGITVLLGLFYLVIQMDDAGRWKWLSFTLPEKVERILMYTVAGSGGVVSLFFLAAGIYLPIEALMKLGYTLVGAITLYVGSLLLLPIPLYCLGGKKLLLKTETGRGLCPVISPK